MLSSVNPTTFSLHENVYVTDAAFVVSGLFAVIVHVGAVVSTYVVHELESLFVFPALSLNAELATAKVLSTFAVAFVTCTVITLLLIDGVPTVPLFAVILLTSFTTTFSLIVIV